MRPFFYLVIALFIAACNLPFNAKKTEIEIEASAYDARTGFVHIETSSSEPVMDNMEIVIPLGASDKRIGLLTNVKREDGGWFGSDVITFDVYVPPSMKEDLLPQLAKGKTVIIRSEPPLTAIMSRSLVMNRDNYIRQTNLGKYSEQLKAMIEPTHNLIPTARLIANPGSSKIGGMPNLPANIEWPESNGRPMSFIMQLKLSDYFKDEEKNTGYIFLFMDLSEAADDSPESFDPWDVAYRVIYHPGEESFSDYRPFPTELTGSEKIDETALRHSALLMLPDAGSASVRRLSFNDTEEESYYMLRSMFESAAVTDIFDNARSMGTYRFLGYPETTTDLQLYAEMDAKGLRDSIANASDNMMDLLTNEAARWRLLLQVDFDYSPLASTGLSGKYYFMIKKKDLDKKRYEEVVMYFESWE